MKHREQVLMALHHEEADGYPLRIRFSHEFAARLKNDLGRTDAGLLSTTRFQI